MEGCRDQMLVSGKYLEKSAMWKRGQGKEQKWREKSIQVVLITTSEKMAAKKNMKEIKKIKDPLQRIFLWFFFFKSSLHGLQNGCTNVSLLHNLLSGHLWVCGPHEFGPSWKYINATICENAKNMTKLSCVRKKEMD